LKAFLQEKVEEEEAVKEVARKSPMGQSGDGEAMTADGFYY